MVTNVLIASPTMAFGELIRLTLEGEGNYRATCVSTGSQALAECQSSTFALVILDSDLGDLKLPDLWAAIQKLAPNTRMILVPPNNDIHSPTIAGLPSDGYLSKPFYLPELVNIVARALQRENHSSAARPAALSSEARTIPSPQTLPTPAIDGASSRRPPSKPIASTAPVWLQDVTRAAQHLTRLSLETAAMAALIIRDGKLWAYAGQLSQPAAQELAQTVAHYWERGNGSDLARFVHLNVTDGDYMLYATAVSGDMALAMVFDIEMPFSKIRSQASRLARSLTTPPGAEPLKPAPEAVPSPAAPAGDKDAPEEEEPLDLTGLTPLFDDVPPAMPGSQPAPDTRKPSIIRPLADRSASVRQETPNPISSYDIPPKEVPPDPDTIPDPAPEEAMQVELEPVSAAICNLNYACMLLPRMPQHSIEGDLAQRLSAWVPQICLAFGWRLAQCAIQPDYMAWVVDVPPNASPSYVMRILRQQTSARIFAHFPILGQENPSNDFWAPGYLIMSSSQLPPESLVKNFIKQTRQRQGVSHPMDLRKIHG